MSRAVIVEETVKPYPPRFWWLKRIFLAVVVLIIALSGLRLWWGYVAHHRLQAAIDAIHARGEPILIEDFAEPELPNRENAAWYLTQTRVVPSNFRVVPSNFIDNLNWNWGQALSSQDLAAVEQYLSANQRVLQMARAARDHRRAAWHTRFKHPAFATLLPSLDPQRAISDLLHLNALAMHQQGSDAQAIEAIRDHLSQANAMSQELPCLVVHLVGADMSVSAAQDALGIAPDLSLEPPGSATRPSGPASRQQVLSLIAELLDDNAYRQSEVRATYGERAMQYDTAGEPAAASHLFAVGRGTNMVFLSWSTLNYSLRPMIDLDAIRILQHTTAQSLAIAKVDYPTAMACAGPDPCIDSGADLRWLTEFWSWVFNSSTNRILQTHFRVLAERRGAAVVLATRLWQADHGGQLPPELSLLVPDYLPQIPADPFAANGAPLRYLPHGPGGPIIYSVRVNGVDDGGNETRLRGGEPPDYVYHLSRPATAPSTQALDHDRNK